MKRTIRNILSLLLLMCLGVGEAWGQTYKYYAIHNKDNGYLKQVNGGIAVDKTFRYENSHDGNGSSIWVLSSEGYLQQEMYYLNVANDQTLYLSTEKVTQWTIDNTTASGKNYLKPSGSSKFLCADSGPQLKGSPSKYLNACEMTITENGNKWEGPKDVSFTVQSPQLVTYLRTYYVRSIIATITKDDADKTDQKVADKKDSRCYCSLTYSTTTDANKGTNWDIKETSGIIYSKQASGDYSVAATYSVAPLDPIVLSNHPATNQTVTLKLQPLPFAPNAEKNYLLFYTKDANYRFPYDDGSLNENDAVKTDASRSVLTEPATSPNNEISWKIVRDDEGFYSFRNVNSGRWLRFDGGQFVDGSDYGVIEVGADGDATPAGNEYKFRLYKSGTYKNTNTAPTYCILPYSKQYAVYKSDGVAANAFVSLSVYTTPKVISLNKANDDSKYCIFAYEAENRIYDFTLSGPSSALVTGDYVFNTTQSYSSRNIKGSPSNVQDLEIKGSYSVADLTFNWEVNGLDGYITKQTPTVSSGKGTQVVTVNSLPSGMLYGKVRVQAKSGSKSSGWKELEFNLYGEPSYTDITSLSQITSSDGYYRLTADVSDAPGVTEFSGFLDGNMHKISGKSAPLFTTLTGTVKNIVLEDVSISGHDGNTGAIACTANGAARIYNVGILSGSVGGTDNTGGLVGYLDGTARVINCYSYADITGGTTVGGIVGYNNVATTATNLKTMVMNCMFYGNITGGTTKSPVYGGKNINNINNNQGGLNTFNYYSYEKLTGGVSDDQYNCALAVEDKYLNRFEYYRLLLNSNKKLAAYYATGSADNGDKMAKWVLETADRTIDNPKPYPVLKAQGYYPSIINPDIEHAPDIASVGRNHGGKLGKTLTVHIGGVGSNAPDGASIRMRGAIQLQRTDKDFDRFNFNYDKVQLPYYNEVGTGNYTDYKVVTGWKITAITAVKDDPYTADNYPATGITDYPNHNYADRKSSNKDLYSVSGRVFSQGAYFDVPYGVKSITIEPYWGNAIYVADQYYDVVYKNDYSGKQGVSQVGTQAVDNTTEFNGQKVRTSITGLGSGTTVYDNAVVLVGNFHLDGVPSGGTVPFTMMSVDMDNDHEPDYSLIYHHKDRTAICPIRFDFLNIPGTAQAQKPNGASLVCNFTIFKTKGWFEVTNTSSFYTSQLEYENLADVSKADAPLILLGGVIDQFVSTQSSAVNGKTIYIHVGGNVWINSFGLGTHSDGSQSTPHVPVSVTGGEYEGLYLTGTYNAGAAVREDNAECYISGGHIVEAAGASLEQINGSVHWQIYNADIDEFFGGGTNDAKPIKGDITTDIYNSNVGLFCGGPKFGNMQPGKNVTTNAEGCIFGKYFGAGYGGTSLSRKKYYDATATDWPGWAGKYVDDRGKYFDGNTTSAPGNSKYGKKGPGVATDMDYEFFVWSSGSTGGRFFVKYATFSLAQCNDVSSTLKKCTVKTNFYGGGNLGKVVGTATSVLEDCTVNGSVYGAGYSASLPTVEVRDGGFVKNPNYNPKSGMFEPAELSGTTPFTWQNAAEAGKTLTNGESGSDLENHILYTNTELTGLGEVAKTELTIKGTTTVAKSVYGGGEESGVAGDTEVNVTSGTIGTQGQGGVEYGNVFGGGKGKVGDKVAGYVKGNTAVNISQAENMTTTILHNVYGGGAYGSVGDFTYDATSGMPTALATENTGVCNIAITGGTIGTNGKENGMIFGSSRGDVATPEGEPAVDPNDRMAWVYSTNVTIGTPSETPSLTTPKIAGSIYGSGENGHTFQNTEVTIHSGTIGIAEGETITDNNGTPDDTSDDKTYSGAAYPYRGNVYGGGCGTDMYWIDANGNDEKDDGEKHYNPIAGIVRGNATVTIDGGHVVRNVYGAGAMGSVGNETEAESASTSGKTIVTIKGKAKIGVDGDDNGNVYGAARGDLNVQEENYANVRETELEINDNADIKGSAFGGGEAGIVWESVAVNMKGGSVANDVYGGGALAKTQIAYTIPANAEKIFTTNVNLTGGTIGHNVYGGGLGRMADETKGVTAVEAKVYGKVLVALNEPKTTTTGEGESAVTTTTYGDCEVKKNIFGCNNLNGSPQDEVTVHIYKTVSKDESGNVKDKPEKNSDTYEVKAVYGGGNLAAYVPKATDASANVIIDGCGLTSIETVYGGGNAASTPATNVTVNGTYEIEEVFGGGNGKDAITINGVTKANPGANVGYKDYSAYETSDDADNGAVTKELRFNNYAYGSGAANVNIYGGTIHRVFGGSNTKGNVRISAVTMLEEVGCEFCVDEAYGGGKSAPMDAEAKLLMACIPGLKEAYGGAKNAEIDGDVTLTITNGTFNRVFGGNDQAGYIKGTITVNIEETGCKPVIIGELYGGGNLAPYTAPAGKHGPTLNVRSFTSIGDIYGGGLGSEAEVTGDTYVNINVCEGRWKDGTYKYATAPSEVGVNDKITELNAKGYHAPSFTSGIGVIHTVFGGGNAAPVIGNTNVLIGTKSDEVFMTPTKKTVTTGTGDTQTTQEVDTTDEERTHAVKGADIRGNVYGGGNNATVSGNTNVVIAKEESVTPAPDPAPDPAPEPEP
ncbi:MAG: hypothetical protein IJ069_06870 [Prevotella sp.]|nr:hypothetical protein [Prevotella sp.]